MQKWIYQLTILLMCLLIMSSLAHGASKPASGQVPTNITSHRMEYSADGQTVTFSGNVHVKRPDFELWAEKLTVFLSKSDSPTTGDDSGLGSMKTGEINRIVAEKNVIMRSEGKEGRCQKATYYTKDDRFVMEGAPVLTEKKNSIKGQTIVHYMKANRSEVQGAVSATFMAPDKTKDGQGPSLIPGTKGD